MTCEMGKVRHSRRQSVRKTMPFPSGFMFLMLIGFCLTTSYAYVTLPLSSSSRIRPSVVPRGFRHTTTTCLATNNPSQPQARNKEAKKKKSKHYKKASKKYYNKNNNINNKLLAQAKALNQAMVKCDSSLDVLKILASAKNALTGLAGGGAMNSINFSTAIHRIARHSSHQKQDRAVTLSDARFAFLLCSLSEALGGIDYTTNLANVQNVSLQTRGDRNTLTFRSRELSNVAWAIAKLRLAPPSSALPVDTSAAVMEDSLQTSFKLRSQILDVARHRQSGDTANDKTWISTLSKLSGRVLDAISHIILSKSTFDFNTQEWANLIWAFATASRADPKVFDHVAKQLLKGMDRQLQQEQQLPKPQELSNSVWAFATAGFWGEAQEELIEYVADMIDSNPHYVEQYKPQELSNTVWGIATILSNKRSADKSTVNKKEDLTVLRILRHVARAIAVRANEFKSQELSNTVWAFATLGFGYEGPRGDLSAMGGNDYIFLASDDLQGDEALVEMALDAVAESALPRLHTFRSQELNNLAWAFSRLGEQETAREVFVGIGNEFHQQHRHFSPQDIGTTLWSFASKEYFDEDVYRTICSRLTIDRGAQFKPQELSNTLWALATAKVAPKYPDAFDTTLVPPSKRLSLSEMSDDPVTLCFAAGATELMRRPYEFKSQEIKDVLWSFSKLGMRHPQLFKSVAEHLVGSEDDPRSKAKARGLGEFSPQGIGNLSWSIAKQAQMVDIAAERVEGSSRAGGKGSSGRLAIFATSCIDIGEVLIQRLFAAIADAALRNHDRLSKLKPQDISNTAWSFAVLGLWHRDFFDSATEQVIRRVGRVVERNDGDLALDWSDRNNSKDWKDRFKGQEIANILWAFATLNHPMADLIDAITPYVVHICSEGGGYDARIISRQFKRQELANIVWSVAVAGRYPPELMKLVYTGLIGSGSESDPEFLGTLYGDGGLQRQAIMSLLYVQMVMDIEQPNNGHSLPPDFPDGWDTDTLITADSDDITETSSMLSLSSSKTQKDVSNALDRIGFQHVNEYVIDVEELGKNHGILLSTKSREILSIDIANLDSKIGIEVDGPGHFVHVLKDNSQQEESDRGFAKVINGKLEWQFMEPRERMNGSTALKDRLLTHLGWRLLRLPYWEWYRVDGDAEKEEEYCKKLLQE